MGAMLWGAGWCDMTGSGAGWCKVVLVVRGCGERCEFVLCSWLSNTATAWRFDHKRHYKWLSNMC